MTGYALLLFGIGVWFAGRRSPNATTRHALNRVMAVLLLQGVLGIVTVIYGAPWHIAIAHQLLAVLLWVMILRARFHAAYPTATSVRGT